MSSIERLETGPRMSQAVIHNGVVYLAGQVADDAKGATVTAQTENIWTVAGTIFLSAKWGGDRGPRYRLGNSEPRRVVSRDGSAAATGIGDLAGRVRGASVDAVFAGRDRSQHSR